MLIVYILIVYKHIDKIFVSKKCSLCYNKIFFPIEIDDKFIAMILNV